ncbi:MAG: hypothetical protein ACRD72_20120 [Candidatus Angelobacter sp.]
MQLFLNEQYIDVPDVLVEALFRTMKEQALAQTIKLGGAIGAAVNMGAREVLRGMEKDYGLAARPPRNANKADFLLNFILSRILETLKGSAFVIEVGDDGSSFKQEWYSAAELAALDAARQQEAYPALPGAGESTTSEPGLSLAPSWDNGRRQDDASAGASQDVGELGASGRFYQMASLYP